MHARSERPISRLISCVRPPTRPLHRLAVAARVRGRRQHRVLGGDPAEPGALAPARHALGDAGRAQHLRVAELDEHRARRVLLEAAGEAHRPQLVVGPAVRSGHRRQPRYGGSVFDQLTRASCSSACSRRRDSAHPLVVHAVVVLLPLAAVGTLDRGRPAALAAAARGPGAAPRDGGGGGGAGRRSRPARSCGESLGGGGPLVEEHAMRGGTLLLPAALFLALLAVTVLVGRRADARPATRPARRTRWPPARTVRCSGSR